MTIPTISQKEPTSQEYITKACKTCGGIFPATTEFFFLDKSSISGLRSNCKKCTAHMAALYRNKNKKALSDYGHNNYLKNRPIAIAKAAIYRSENRKKIAEQSKKSRIKNKDKISLKAKTTRQKNKDKIYEWRVKYNEANKEKISITRAKYYYANKESKAKYGKEYRQKNITKISKRIAEYQSGMALYSTYVERLSLCEDVRESDINVGKLETKCAYCGKWFAPSVRSVTFRINAVSSELQGEGRLYCSKGCKDACPIYKRIKYPKGFKVATSREANPQLRQIVLERDSYTCQKCGDNKAALHCHHITPATQNPGFADDPDSCITLCKTCHKEVHKQDGCRYHELTCKDVSTL